MFSLRALDPSSTVAVASNGGDEFVTDVDEHCLQNQPMIAGPCLAVPERQRCADPLVTLVFRYPLHIV